MANADWGTKRNCVSCSTKFYDFNRDPILCPSCGKELLLVKQVRIKLNKYNNEKTSKDDLPEKWKAFGWDMFQISGHSNEEMQKKAFNYITSIS